MYKELISIILCTRNIKNINPDVLSSIVSQTYSTRELIIVEGIRNNNEMRNEGFSKSRGEYIFNIDEDVILQPDCILLLYDEIIKSNVDFVYCDYDRIGTLTGIHYAKPFSYEKLKQMNYISTMSLIKRSMFPGFDPKIKRLQDYDLFLTITENGGIGSYVNKCLFTAIYNEGCISNRGTDNWIESVNIVKNKHNINK